MTNKVIDLTSRLPKKNKVETPKQDVPNVPTTQSTVKNPWWFMNNQFYTTIGMEEKTEIDKVVKRLNWFINNSIPIEVLLKLVNEKNDISLQEAISILTKGE